MSRVGCCFWAVLSALAVLPVLDAKASPWPRSKGSLFFVARADHFAANGAFLLDSMGEDRFERIDFNLYTEYGVTDRLMVGGDVIYGRTTVSSGDLTEVSEGLTELEAYVQYAVWEGDRAVASARLTGTLPARFDSGARPEIVADGVDVEGRLLYGRSMPWLGDRVFVMGEAAYRKRISDAADQVRFDVGAGVDVGSSWLILMQAFNIVSARNADIGDFDLYRAQPSIVYRPTDRLGVQVGVLYDYASRNFTRGRTIFAGLWASF